MYRLLELAEFLCGGPARRSVFEPLVADWQRQWQDAPATRWSRAKVVTAGFAAFLVALLSCLVRGETKMNIPDVVRGLAALLISTVALLAMQIGLNSLVFPIDYLFEIRFWMALPMIVPFAIPLGLLPALMLMRGRGLTKRAAALIAITGAVLAVLATGWLTPRLQGDFINDRLAEAMHERMLAHDRAGRYQYPGSAVRALKPTTPAQRAEQRAQWRSDPRYIAAMQNRNRPRWVGSTFMTGGLALALAALGWSLGGIGRTRATHAVGWWALAVLAVMIFEGRAVFALQRSPQWVPIAVFGGAALVLRMVLAGRPRTDVPVHER